MHARERAAVRDRRCARRAAGRMPRRNATAGPLDGAAVSNTTPAEYERMVRCAPRSTSPPATFSRWCCRSASRRRSSLPPFALYRALRRVNPSPVPLLPRLRRLLDRRLEPGNPGAGARRHRDHPPDRRHAAARRDAARGQGARGRAAGRSEGARRAPDAARPRPQRRRPRRARSAP